MTTKWQYEASTKTIRSVPENYWIATMDSWDKAVDHEANAKLIAAAPEMIDILERAANCLGERGIVSDLWFEMMNVINKAKY